MNQKEIAKTTREAEEEHLKETLEVVLKNMSDYSREVGKMQADIDEMLEHYHDNDMEVLTILNNTITLHDHMKRALLRNAKAQSKPYFGRIVFWDETFHREESLYIGKGGIAKDATHQIVTDWRAPVANVYYENGLGECSYPSPDGGQIEIDLRLKRTYEIEKGRLLDFYDTEVVANDDLLTKYLAKSKQAVLGEIIATIQKEQNDIIRKTPYHNVIVQGVAGSGKTTVAMHRISFILYNYQERFKPEDFYIVGSNRILLNYITGVLPDLDVQGVRQMTMEQLFVRLLYEDWDEKRYKILDAGQMSPREGVKGTLKWFRDLERYCRSLEWRMIPRDPVVLDRRQFVEGIQEGKTGVFDRREQRPAGPGDLVSLLSQKAIEDYILQNPSVSVQSKIDMLNERLLIRVKDEFIGKNVSYTEGERKAILRAYRGIFGSRSRKWSVFEMYRDFLTRQIGGGYEVRIPGAEFDVYDLAALAYLYKRIKETEVISEAHHVVIDEAQDFGMMAYSVLKFCIKDCTYTIMGDVSQNIHFGYGLNDWEELKKLILSDEMDSFGVLKKSYRNTVEISEFAADILHHGQFSIYPVEPIIRHGNPVQLLKVPERKAMLQKAAQICRDWQEKGLETIAVICRDRKSAQAAAEELSGYIEVLESDLETAVFGSGIMVLPVEYTKGLEFDAVLVLDPSREEYPVDDGHAKLLYVAATRALHELCVLHTGNLTGLIADPLPEERREKIRERKGEKMEKVRERKEEETEKTRTRKEETAVQRPHVSGRKKISLLQTQAKGAPGKGEPGKGERQSNTRTGAQAGPYISGQKSAGHPADKGRKPGKAGPENAGFAFGDMPATEKLRPAGRGKIDLSIRWVAREADGLYIQSRYGILRLSPIAGNVVRVTFAKEREALAGYHPQIILRRTERMWMYRESGGDPELTTDELCLRVDRKTGAVRYLTWDKKLLLSERAAESRQIETGFGKTGRAWLFLDWQKGEKLYGMNRQGTESLPLRGSARYLSQVGAKTELPLLVSERGYGILMAAEGEVICCDVPAYGSYLFAEKESRLDYYFIAGKGTEEILRACAELCGGR